MGVITAQRPDALRRCLDSYLDHFDAHRRRMRLLVMDDSVTRERRRQTRAVVNALGPRRGGEIALIDRPRRAQMADRLAAAAAVPVDVVRFALEGVPGWEPTVGANHNALLLAAAGEALFMADDDTVCAMSRLSAAASPDSAGPRDPWHYWYEPESRSPQRLCVAAGDVDLIALHEAALSMPVPGGGRVVTALNGLSGDCGWGAPFGCWGRPLGFLLAEGVSRQRLVADETAYRAACQGRTILKAVGATAVTPAAPLMSTFMSLDARLPVPPLLPVMRGQDMLFGQTLTLAHPDAHQACLPVALAHEPTKERRFWPGEVLRTAGAVDVAALVAACHAPLGADLDAPSPAARMQQLGQRLAGQAALTPRAFHGWLHEVVCADRMSFLAAMDEALHRHGRSPSFWAADVEAYVEALRCAMARADYCLPVDLPAGTDDRLQQCRRLMTLWGRLLQHWPAIMEAAGRQPWQA